ncbi:MAG: TlpA disulfide reductase family protein [Candidatus Thiodiazotropha sp.]
MALQIGESMPDFSLPDAEGEPMIVPSALRGRVVLIHFWADWCPACLKELVASKELIQRYRSEGLAILAVNLKQSPQEVAEWIERITPNYPVLFDHDGRAAAAFGITGLPSSYLIDREGRLQRRLIGEMQTDQLLVVLEKML